MRRSRERMVSGGLTLALLLAALPAHAEPANLLRFSLAGGAVRVDPSTMEITGAALVSRGADGLGRVEGLRRNGDGVSWQYPERGYRVWTGVRDGRLRVTVHGGSGRLRWPVTGADPATSRLVLPRGEGLSVPVRDTWWAGRLGKVALTDGMTLPFWGQQLAGRGVSYLVSTDIGTELDVSTVDNRLHATAEHRFDERTPELTVDIGLTEGSPVAAAADYRRFLAAKGGLGSLKEKIGANPAAGKLLGALHAYGWGQAREVEGVRRLKELGLDRLWLGYDGEPMSKEAIAAAKKAGFLAGPYDSWDNAQDPATADNPGSVWPGNLWPEGCVRKADGSLRTGFGGRGCYLSTAALSSEVYRDRVRKWTANGAETYFLDVDAAGQLFDDHAPAHPMTQEQDRRNRLARMAYLSGERGLVLGSETAAGWANRVLAFNHGSLTPVTDALWAEQKRWGAWYPEQAPAFFFKPVELSAELTRFMFDPAVRVPLYQTVLHDSLIATDRWELPLSKLPALAKDRILLALLYNTPPNLVLDKGELDRHGERIAELHRAFAPLHKLAGAAAMTGFRWVNGDPLVQETEFDNGLLRVRADFRSGCVRTNVSAEYCPASW
ncbi:glycoside hydrolase [Crossiella sp. SN42]|uniref:glycoside hydrolase n=1 Tax=Crossiella sp. SN42 TaxID=2944808 RepID=UPI00207C9C79|nr:glycoside hydrolase [Crossiella sp. SN42]MCO1575699.1 glycoside hydrolase [Crossiella sp. SN42]